MSVSPTPRRLDRRDPRLPLARLADLDSARRLWQSLPVECQSDFFDKSNMPEQYQQHIRSTSSGSGGQWSTQALNARSLPEMMTWEIAWLINREIELGRIVDSLRFNCSTRVLRVATANGGHEAERAESLLHLTPDEWVAAAQRASLRGVDLGKSNMEFAGSIISRWQDVLVYEYPHGDWWRLDVWNPTLDARVPRRRHEPNGNQVANFSHLTEPWLREAAKWWLSVFLENETYTWSTIKTRMDSLKWFQRHLDAHPTEGPHLFADRSQLRPFIRSFVATMQQHIVRRGPTKGQRLGKVVRRAAIGSIEQFYRFMYDNRHEAAQLLDDPRWLNVGYEHTVLFRPEDKPRLVNQPAVDQVLEDDVIAAIAAGAEVLAAPKSEGGIGDVQAFHALLLLLRTGRRLNEILMIDFDPLLPLAGATRIERTDERADTIVARLRYQETKIGTHRPTIPVDNEVVALVRAQQHVARQFMAARGTPGVDPKYLFLRQYSNQHGQAAYASATLNQRLRELSERLGLVDSQGRAVRISKTHSFRHTKATNLINLGVPLHVVMRWLGHVTPSMTMHYAQTLSETAEREFVRFTKVTSDGRDLDASDVFDVLHLDQRADRILPNGYCLLPPKQTCNRGNACLTCGEFVTDETHRADHETQRETTERLIGTRRQAFQDRYGTPMPDDNVWLIERNAELQALDRIVTAIDRHANGVRGPAVSTAVPVDAPTRKENR